MNKRQRQFLEQKRKEGTLVLEGEWIEDGWYMSKHPVTGEPRRVSQIVTCTICGATGDLIPVPFGGRDQVYCRDVTPCLNRREAKKTPTTETT